MPSLPFLVSIPHGGTSIPDELKTKIQISDEELLADGDPFTGDIYEVKNDVHAQVNFAYARAIVDVNRASGDLPPQNPDGVIKSVSIFNNRIYKAGHEPDQAGVSTLIQKYYEPYHRKIREILDSGSISFAFDCHSMEAIGPPVARDAGIKRPLFCLGNNYGKACSEEITLLFADCLAAAFSVPAETININDPFSGGYITQRYGMNPVPWLQIEMNRNLYLSGSGNLNRNHFKKQVSDLNSCFRKTLENFKKKKSNLVT